MRTNRPLAEAVKMGVAFRYKHNVRKRKTRLANIAKRQYAGWTMDDMDEKYLYEYEGWSEYEAHFIARIVRAYHTYNRNHQPAPSEDIPY